MVISIGSFCWPFFCGFGVMALMGNFYHKRNSVLKTIVLLIFTLLLGFFCFCLGGALLALIVPVVLLVFGCAGIAWTVLSLKKYK